MHGDLLGVVYDGEILCREHGIEQLGVAACGVCPDCRGHIYATGSNKLKWRCGSRRCGWEMPDDYTGPNPDEVGALLDGQPEDADLERCSVCDQKWIERGGDNDDMPPTIGGCDQDDVDGRTGFDEFFVGYLTAALWSSEGGEDGDCHFSDLLDFDGREVIGLNSTEEDWVPEAYKKLKDEARRFFTENREDLSKREWSKGGHDFWLTRNGHGCGYWETPDWPETEGKRLTEAAKHYGEISIYRTNDGKVDLL